MRANSQSIFAVGTAFVLSPFAVNAATMACMGASDQRPRTMEYAHSMYSTATFDCHANNFDGQAPGGLASHTSFGTFSAGSFPFESSDSFLGSVSKVYAYRMALSMHSNTIENSWCSSENTPLTPLPGQSVVLQSEETGQTWQVAGVETDWDANTTVDRSNAADLKAIPEPSSGMALLGTAVYFAFGLRRRRPN